jgi:hypothetical protein
MTMTRTKLILLAICALGLPTVAAADTKTSEQCREDAAQAAKKPSTYHYEMIGGKQTMVVTTEIIICGHPAKPSVVILTTPKSQSYQWESLEQHMLPRILDSVKHAPFAGDRSR